MAELRLIATAADIKAAFSAADEFADTLPKKTADGTRIPIDARRADALVALVTGASGSSQSGTRPVAAVQVSMDLATLLGLRDNPAELAGYGPIPASAARALAADGTWRRLIHEPLTGALLDLGQTSYRPSAALDRFIRSRDAYCTFPGCNQPAHRCELDHTCPYACGPAGRTDRNNLGALCENHHIVKHETDWRLRRDQTTHEATWTSPTGHDYPVKHHDHRCVQTPEVDVGPVAAPAVSLPDLPPAREAASYDPGASTYNPDDLTDPIPEDPHWRADMHHRSPPEPHPGHWPTDYRDNGIADDNPYTYIDIDIDTDTDTDELAA